MLLVHEMKMNLHALLLLLLLVLAPSVFTNVLWNYLTNEHPNILHLKVDIVQVMLHKDLRITL